MNPSTYFETHPISDVFSDVHVVVRVKPKPHEKGYELRNNSMRIVVAHFAPSQVTIQNRAVRRYLNRNLIIHTSGAAITAALILATAVIKNYVAMYIAAIVCAGFFGMVLTLLIEKNREHI